MFFLKGIAIVLAIFIYVVLASILKLVLIFLSPNLYLQILSHLTQKFSQILRLILNIKVAIEGEIKLTQERGNFIISNHLGYLDGIVISSLFPLVFISKHQVKSWPLFGLMAMVGGTIFIQRYNRSRSIDYIRQTVIMLKRKVNVLLFPEGTSTDGERLFDFQSVHFQAPLEATSGIIPVLISYSKINSQPVTITSRDNVCWYGQISFISHLLKGLKLNSLEANVKIYPGIDLKDATYTDCSRKVLSESLYKLIADNYPLFH